MDIGVTTNIPPIIPKEESISIQINSIFETNKLEDLKMFLNSRHTLNKYNIILIYLFYIVQTAGILTTTIAAGYDMKMLVWVGVGLNCIASLIHIFEKTNTTISKKYMKDIEDIKNNNYIDESVIDFDISSTTPPKSKK
jgi:hypothetical protein